MRKIGLVAGLVAMVVPGGCTRGTPAPIAQDTFVSTMVELRRATGGAPAAGFEAERRAVLERNGVSEAELHAYVRWASREPERLRESFDRITEQLREPTEE